MHIVATNEDISPKIQEKIEDGVVVINFESVIEDELKNDDHRSLSEFYRQATSDDPMRFARELVQSWIKWTDVQSRRVVESPENKYLVYNLYSNNEFQYLRKEFDSNVTTIRRTEEGKWSTFSISVPQKQQKLYSEGLLTVLLNELADNQRD